MRLIDADKLELNCIYTSTLEKADTVYQYSYSERQIEKAPTVEAIPIEWIEHYVKNHFCFADWYGGFIGGVNMMLEDWEKENGKENN